jgi:WD40 repeat protein
MITWKTILPCMVLVMLNFHCVTDKPVEPIEVTYTAEGLVTCTQTGEPIDSVLVRAVSLTLPDDEFPFTYTDSQGIYSLYLGEGSGIDIIQFEKEGFRTEYRTIIIDNIPQKNSTILIDVQLTPHDGPAALYIEGVVRDNQTDTPIEKVSVLMGLTSGPEDTRMSTCTDSNGFFSLSITSGEGLYFLYFEREMYWSFTLYVDIGNEPMKHLDISLIPEDKCPNESWGHQVKNCYGFREVNPSWSPDGRYIAYITSDRKRGSISGIYVYDTQQNTERLVLDWPDNMTAQAWSPDGQWITFSMGKQIYKKRSDGTALTQLTNNPEREYFYPVWSPDGEWIAYEDRTPITHYESEYPDSVLKRGIWVMSSNGTNQQWYLRYAHHNTWNPVQLSQILSITSIGAFVDDRFLFWYSTNSAKDTLIVRDKAINRRPHFSPDGDKIVFDSSLDGDIDIWVINSDGTGLQRLTTNGGAQPAWSPDGQTIAYVNIDLFEGKGKIWLMNPDGTNRRPMRR